MDISGMYFDSCSGPARVVMVGVPAYLALLILQWASGKWTLSKMIATAVLLQVSDRGSTTLRPRYTILFRPCCLYRLLGFERRGITSKISRRAHHARILG